MGMRRATVLVAVLAAALLAGCGGTPDESPTPGGSVSVPPPSPSPSPTLPEDLPTPAPPSASGKPTGGVEMTISGQVVEGVEPGCRLLASGGVSYLLLPSGGVRREDIPAGARVTVRGHPDAGMMTTCQQGTPFVVTEVLPG